MYIDKGYPHKECAVSTGIHDGPTIGHGKLDSNGFWEFPCYECARVYEQHTGEKCWPFKEYNC
jgi:hypothetical protein